MFRGFYAAASGMISQQRQQEMISNNIANVNTPGYKADQISLRSFPEMLIQQMNGTRLPLYHNSVRKTTSVPVGTLNTGVYAQELTPHFVQGILRETELATDLAIVDGQYPDETGSIFFTVQNEAGDVRYTRNGNFTVDGEGYLTTNEGNYVLDSAGNQIFTDGLEFVVTTEGNIEIGAELIPLQFAYFANANDLVKEGNDLFNAEPGDAVAVDPATVNATFTVQQGFLEGSNVDPSRAMVDMIQAYRNFELNQRVLKEYDETMRKAATEVGRLG